MNATEKAIFDRVGGGVPFYKELGRMDGADNTRKRKRAVTQNFKLAYAVGFYEGKRGKI